MYERSPTTSTNSHAGCSSTVDPKARNFLAQLEQAEVTPWHCPRGCASFNFQIKGQPEAPPGVRILSEFLAGEGESLSGVFIFESGGPLSGIEVYGLAGEVPAALSTMHELRLW